VCPFRRSHIFHFSDHIQSWQSLGKIKRKIENSYEAKKRGEGYFFELTPGISEWVSYLQSYALRPETKHAMWSKDHFLAHFIDPRSRLGNVTVTLHHLALIAGFKEAVAPTCPIRTRPGLGLERRRCFPPSKYDDIGNGWV